MNILLTSDFSEQSEAAISFLSSFIKDLKLIPDITILHCIEHISSSRLYYGLGIDVENIILNCEEEADRQMKRITELLNKAMNGDKFNFKSEIIRSKGSVGAEIVDYAESNNFDLLLIARKGHSAMKHVIFGSVSEYVIRHITCPVLVVPDSTALEK